MVLGSLLDRNKCYIPKPLLSIKGGNKEREGFEIELASERAVSLRRWTAEASLGFSDDFGSYELLVKERDL